MKTFKEFLEEKQGIIAKAISKSKELIKKYTISLKQINDARKELSKKYNVKEKFLRFEYIWEPIDKEVYAMFNILDQNHERYKSTINHLLKV